MIYTELHSGGGSTGFSGHAPEDELGLGCAARAAAAAAVAASASAVVSAAAAVWSTGSRGERTRLRGGANSLID